MEQLERIVEAFAEKVASAAAQLLSANAVSVDKIIAPMRIFEKFEYIEDGHISSISSVHNQYIDSWQRASVKVLQKVGDCIEYQQCEEGIKFAFPETLGRKQQIQNLVFKILDIYFKSPDPNWRPAVNVFINRFIAEINGAEIKFVLLLHLNGIAVGPEPIHIRENILLRRPQKQDFEKPQTTLVKSVPQLILSAILEITYFGNFHNIPPIEVDKYCYLFKLFGVGPINYLSYELLSTSAVQLFLPRAYDQFIVNSGLQFLAIGEQVEDKLKQFYTDLEIKVNILTSQGSVRNFLRIAFDRYNEALLENSIFERKIANIIMAFEALFSNKELEIAYSLSLLVAKFFNYFTKNSTKIREEIKTAYDIRSKFTHGEVYKEKKLEALRTKYGSEHEFLKQMLEYLRISIVIFLYCEFDKEELVKKLDASILDDGIAAGLKLEIEEALPYV